MKTSSAIYYISYEDVSYGLFFYLSDFDLFVKIYIKKSEMGIDCLSMLPNNYNKSTFAVGFGPGVCLQNLFYVTTFKCMSLQFRACTMQNS